MEHNTKFRILISISIFLVFILNVNECARGGGGGSRGGGGGSRGGGSSFRGGSSGARFSGGSSRSGSGARTWTNVASGLLAYNIMSRLAYRSSMHHGPGYYYRSTPRNKLGSYCTNLENFNGTVIGKVQCPIDEFPDDYTYCCGPTDYEYCCKFFDDTGRTVGIVFAVLAFVGIVIGIIFCIIRCKQRNTQKNPGAYQVNSNARLGPTVVPLQGQNPNMRPGFGPQQAQMKVPPTVTYSANQSQPFIQTVAPYPASAPTNQTNEKAALPYPASNGMPNSLPYNNTPYPPQTNSNINPPSYSDVLQTDQNKVENQTLLPTNSSN